MCIRDSINAEYGACVTVTMQIEVDLNTVLLTALCVLIATYVFRQQAQLQHPPPSSRPRHSTPPPSRFGEDSDPTADQPSPLRRNGSRRSITSPNPPAPVPRRGSVLSAGDPQDEEMADRDLDAVWEGFSMEDARKHSELRAAEHHARTPAQVLGDLQRGNARFWLGQSAQKHSSAFERRALIMKQYPSCAILGCSDSRVPIEIVFDQGLGDMFVIRVAGNCLDTTTRASLEYAVHHLQVKVLMVMGHEGCGAVKAAGLPLQEIEAESSNLSTMLKGIKTGLDEERLLHVHDPRAHDREAVVTNVRRQVETLSRDESIMSKVRSQELIVLGGFYEISSGIVDFFHQVSEVDSIVSPGHREVQASPGVQSVLEVLSPRGQEQADVCTRAVRRSR
eukprot:TRINITY_DN8123_c0_g1_i3.p1 TRINITY_DN8123_c0_g1~~TRINITY_DN8123_c0_g1_i3.p1  ORF type:complete len:393 (-),score=76.54 TRINITY_DN8123_c0_g1_i3:144-1322(-)